MQVDTFLFRLILKILLKAIPSVTSWNARFPIQPVNTTLQTEINNQRMNYWDFLISERPNTPAERVIGHIIYLNGGSMSRNTSHCLHIFIFLSQLSRTHPWQIVPLINQQRWPAWNSHAGQFCLMSTGHFRISQQGRFFWAAAPFLRATRKSIWRSVYTGMFRHPCSKLCMALGETPNNCAIWLCVFPKYRRILENSSFPTEHTPFSIFHYTTL